MKKVLVIAPYTYLPYSSGGQKYIAKFLEHLGKETSLTVIGTSTNDWTLAKGYVALPLLTPSFSRYYDSSLVKKISMLIEREGHEILILEHPYMAWLAFRIRKRTGIKVIIQTHNIEYQRFRSLGKWWWPVLKEYEKRSFKKADALFFITKEDREFAIENWQLEAVKCYDVPFGIDHGNFPADREESKVIIYKRHGIRPGDVLLSFNGVLNYKPNLDALKIILTEINPRLMKQDGFHYKILISGRDLPSEMKELLAYEEKNIVFTGFAEDIEKYLEATDVFLNPVQSGGGIKTKIVEAIGYGATVVSMESGAEGLNKEVCGEKLFIIKDNDWGSFTSEIIKASNQRNSTPPGFYQYYQWQHIVTNLLETSSIK
ncbi:MAG TPA: glycosyltransferase family 4 protein [Chitinophagaceae bacterium]|nr:glycosyltransferase family 4 protein [Chitinophagaceae bacterium]